MKGENKDWLNFNSIYVHIPENSISSKRGMCFRNELKAREGISKEKEVMKYLNKAMGNADRARLEAFGVWIRPNFIINSNNFFFQISFLLQLEQNMNLHVNFNKFHLT